ncbi:MAG: hypothetical protein ABS62_08770 [Microbacterium sp. SCN 70-200]|uniref:CotH kinase family protein n=1 Tax=unclassified Microbacterium TaxID=2609290 RepID=UPI00086D5230|nr:MULTISPECIES: CotH kinase family protein [unclassified Microbacterium]MBN9213283.1 CotH kinase family protein [Microbacterium sp.]ODT40656.1 MAG: hypothetical protein ABS62_08770 [Microbacterium sp. SCN 70-200]OJV83653.1 MAG: hypothetical protein BGO46_11515 [Microbacterium sp. 70-16]
MSDRRHPLLAVPLAVVLTVTVAGCAVTATTSSSASSSTSTSTTVETSTDTSASTLWDSSTVHEISVDYDASDYDAMIQAYLDSGDKEWISATVVIDAVTYENVGLKLKGNSTLRSLSTDADATLSSQNPEDLPWIIRLDKYFDGQNFDGTTELVVRGNSTETSLNEAVALGLLEDTGLAAEQAIAVRFSADGSEEALRLVIENPDDEWTERELGDGLLYKADASGDYSYRGDDPASYDDVFDQEAGEDDLTPLIDFLQWINESDDATFAAELDQHLDVDAFATYLAFQELVDNFDDIDGPGNNSYLYYDPDTGKMTVVNWDLNLAFGTSNVGGGGGGGQMGGGGRGGAGADRTDGAAVTTAARGGGGGGSNILSERFLANADFQQLYQDALTTLQAELFDSGTASELLEAWTTTLTEGASDLVDAATIASDAAAISAKFPS